jgi:hypothetical protein
MRHHRGGPEAQGREPGQELYPGGLSSSRGVVGQDKTLPEFTYRRRGPRTWLADVHSEQCFSLAAACSTDPITRGCPAYLRMFSHTLGFYLLDSVANFSPSVAAVKVSSGIAKCLLWRMRSHFQ